MLNLLKRLFNLRRWLSSIAIFLVGTIPGIIAYIMASEAVLLGWFGDWPDFLTPELWAFWAAATLALSLLNLCLKRPLTQPATVAAVLVFVMFVMTGVTLSMALYGGGSISREMSIFGAVVVVLVLLLLQGLLKLKDTSRKMTGIQAVGSGLLVLYLLFPWQYWILQRLSGKQRNTLAKIVFGQAFLEAKRAVENCSKFQQYAGTPVTLTITSGRQRGQRRSSFDYEGSFQFDYVGPDKQGGVWTLIMQGKPTEAEFSDSDNIHHDHRPKVTSPLTPKITVEAILSPPDDESEPISLDCSPP